MRKPVLLAVALVLAAGTASAATQHWKTGWDNFSEPLNLSSSVVKWSASATTHHLKITYSLFGANPSKLYQVGFHLICTTAPAMFGRFPIDGGAGPCGTITRQGVTRGVAAAELGVILTDISGNGTLLVDTGAVTPGTYTLEFNVRNGAGCNLTGGAGNGSDCSADFQSPGPFGTTTSVVIN